jgi:osmotically inducible lipoprotein OsmB
MRRVIIPVALAGGLLLGGCQGMNADTGERTVGGAAIGAAGGAIIGALAGAPGTGAAIGALAGSSAGLLYDQYRKGEGQ